MKPKFCNLFLASSTLLSISFAQATTYYWDVNGTNTGFSTVIGGWNGTNAFWNDQVSGTGGTPTATVGSTDDLNIVGATVNTGAITLTGARAASSITFASGVGAVTMSGAGSSLSLGGTGVSQGIFNNSASAQTISTAITLASAATINNSGAGLLSMGGSAGGTINLNGFALTFSGTGVTTFNGSASNVISGAGGIIKNGTGSLILDAGAPNALHLFSGGIIVNGGAVQYQSGANVTGRGNVTLNGGYLSGRFGSGATFAGGLGTGTTSIQILGGTSGFSGEGGTGSTFTIGTALSVLKWGAAGENGATGFFNPTVLLLGGDAVGTNPNGKGSLNNGIDLNGTTRTITALAANGDGALNTGMTILGAISTSTGTAGIIKTGPGNISFNAANTYNGGTTISGGTLTLNAASTLGTNVNTNNISLAAGTRLNLSNAVNTGANQTITLTSTAASLSVLALGYNGIPNAAIAQADTNGGVIAINSVAGYNQNLSSRLTGNNFFLGGIGTTTTFTGAAGTIAAGNGSLYRLGGGGGTISFNTANLFTGANAVQIGSTATNGTGTVVFGASQNFSGVTTVNSGSTLSLTASQAFTNTVTVNSGAALSTANTISVASPITNAGTLTFGGVPTFAGLVSSSNGMTLSGAGPFTFNGGLTLSGGTVAIGTAGTTISGSGLLTLSGGVVFNVPNSGAGTIINNNQLWNGNFSSTLVSASGQTITSNGTVTMGANVTISSKNAWIYNAAIGETGGARNLILTNNSGVATFTFNGVNTYTGTTTINNASTTLIIGGSGQLGSGNYGAAIINNGGQLTYSSSADQILSGNISGTGGKLTKNTSSSSILTLSGTNSYTGGTIISAGTLVFGKIASKSTTGTHAFAAGTTLGLGVGGTGFFTAGDITNAFAGTMTGNLAGITVTTTTNVGVDTTAGDFTYATSIAGSPTKGLAKLGTNTLILTGANTYTGTTTISGGTLQLGAGGATGSIANTSSIINNAALAFNRSDAFSVSTAISGTGVVNQIGAGTTTLDGASANTYTGLTTVTAGILELNKTAGTNAIASNVGLGGNDKTTDILVNGGALNWLASNQVSDNASINVTSGSVNFGSADETIYDFNNSGGSVNYGTGTVTILDPTWSGGTNEIHGNTTFGVLNISGGTNTVFGAAGPNGGPGTLTVGSTGGLNFSGTASPNLTVNSDAGIAGKVVLAGDVTSTVTAGTASITSGGVAANPGQLDLGAATRSFTVDNGSAATDLLISAQMIGTGVGLTKEGAGTLELTAANTYTGATAVNAGVLAVNGSLANTSTSVGNTATLQGSGSIAGAVSVQNGGTLAAGNNDIQSLATGALTMASGSNFAYDIADNSSTGADLLAVNGTLSLTGVNLTFDLATVASLSGGGWSSGNTLTLMSYSGSDITSGFTGYTDDTDYAFGANLWTFNYNNTVAGNNFGTDAVAAGQNKFVTMTFSAVPEPRAALLGAIGLLALLRRKR